MRVDGDKIVLREKRLTDATNDYAWSTDPELARLDAAQPLTLSFRDAKVMYEEELLYPAPRRRRFAVETKEGVHIGNCMYYDVNERKGEAELGIMIGDRRFWNNAYGTDAVTTLLRYMFTKINLRKVYLHTLDWNARAQKSFEKSGFRSVGQIERNGHRFLRMEIKREEWEALETQRRRTTMTRAS